MPAAAPVLNVRSALADWWKHERRRASLPATATEFVEKMWEFLRDSTPQRRRLRYGDAEFDWEYRVNTSSGTTSARERFLGLFHSPYQPTDPGIFREMMASLTIDLENFIFIDVGSGKGRALLLAAEYPFRRIIGVELLPQLHQAAEENIQRYRSATQRCFELRSVCADARYFVFPEDPLLLYLFNPLPEAGLTEMLSELERFWRKHPRPMVVVYHNPLHDHLFASSEWLVKLLQTHQYSIYAATTSDATFGQRNASNYTGTSRARIRSRTGL